MHQRDCRNQAARGRLAGVLLAASATFAATTVASAGFSAGGGPEGNIDQMMVGAGYFDFIGGGAFDFVDILITADDPPVGTVISLLTAVPGVETTGAILEWTDSDGPTATFASATLLELFEDVPEGYQGAFSGHRLVFTTNVAVEVNLSSLLSTQGDALGFFYDYQPGNYVPVVFFGDFDYSITLEAGTNTIAWGVLGGLDDVGNPALAEMESMVSLTLVPAPGAIWLIAAAGGLGSRRSRARI